MTKSYSMTAIIMVTMVGLSACGSTKGERALSGAGIGAGIGAVGGAIAGADPSNRGSRRRCCWRCDGCHDR
jgi:osmotically inducible lipoprotein OsmB